jgi:tetratricopeptide (TPR) repeat protein
MAAEISLADVAERNPRSMKQSKALLEDRTHLPRQITELAGAVATNEMVHGNRKVARRLFGRSVADPTGNALAQAEWASETIGHQLVQSAQLSGEDAQEARALHLIREGHFEHVPVVCEAWADLEPYSIRPFEFGSSYAGVLEQFDKAIELAKRGLKLRPDAPALLNCLAFSSANIGDFPEALSALRGITEEQGGLHWHVALANRGLIALRQGQREEGERHYRSAIAGFQRAGLPYSVASARAHFALEAVRAGLPNSDTILKEACKDRDKFKGSVVDRVLLRAEALRSRILEGDPVVRPPALRDEQTAGFSAGPAVRSQRVAKRPPPPQLLKRLD